MFAKIMFLISLAGLAGVFSLEHFFNFMPCDLCVKQRILTSTLIILSLATILIEKFNKKISYVGEILITLNICCILGLSIFQIGIEKKIFSLPETCQHSIKEGQSIEEIRNSLMSMESLSPSCDVPQMLFGLSLATWTVLGALILFLITLRHWILKFKNNALDNVKRKT